MLSYLEMGLSVLLASRAFLEKTTRDVNWLRSAGSHFCPLNRLQVLRKPKCWVNWRIAKLVIQHKLVHL